MNLRLSGHRTGRQAAPRRAFTLIELMVVILIIAILASLLLVAVQGAMARAKEARTIIEIDQMAQALEAYRSKYGDYPPIGVANGSETAAQRRGRIQAHLIRAFPRYSASSDVLDDLVLLTPPEALVFWLGGMPISSGTGYAVEGFSANVGAPFVPSNIGAWNPDNVPVANRVEQRTTPFFSFDPRRLVNVAGTAFPEYVPHGGTTPYAYFPATSYYPANVIAQWTAPNGSVAVPYRLTTGVDGITSNWASPGTFQIIAPGADDSFGGAAGVRQFPSGIGYGTDDEDNLVNFARTRLGNARP